MLSQYCKLTPFKHILFRYIGDQSVDLKSLSKAFWNTSKCNHVLTARHHSTLFSKNIIFHQLNKQNCSITKICHRNAKLPSSRRSATSTGGPITWRTVGIVSAIGLVWILIMKFFKAKKEEELDAELIHSYGRPALGGDFELVDQDGKTTSNRDFIGQWILIYFGFTHCPDICPEELEKMGNAVDTVNRTTVVPNLQPVFISIDPERDTPEAVKKYISDFHPSMIGLTGTREQVDAASRAFRVYYSEGPKDGDDDYLVDHTVIMYLINDKGEFCEYFGQTKSAGEIASLVTANMIKSIRKK